MGKLMDLMGQKFGELTIIKRSGSDKRRKALWLCKCSCGTEKIISGNNLRKGNTKSCGCLQRKRTGECNRLAFGLSSMHQKITNYKNNAKRRGLNYNLTEEQFAEITKKDCHYCGAEPSGKTIFKRGYGAYVYNGLDRIDSNKGYTINNVVPCCSICNYAKRKLTTEEFQDWIRRIYRKMEREL